MRRLVFALLILTSAGASADTLPRRAALGAGVEDKDGGVRVNFVRPDSAAARAGLSVGDVVLAIGGETVATSAGFVARVKTEPAGKPIAVAIRRGGAELSVPVTLGPAPEEHDAHVTTLYESVRIDGTLRRTLLTVPNGVRGRRPAVLILGGIGCFSIDNAADGEDAYMRLAHDLGRRGIVVMRLEKSGIGDSQGAPCATVDLVSEMTSYRAALAALARDPHVDKSRVYLFGHSIGTLMAPRLAIDGGVAGVVIAEGVGRNWLEYELANLRRQLELGGETPTHIDALLAEKEICMHRLLVEKQAEADIERDMPDCKEHNAYPAPAAYLQQAAALNIAEPWEKLALPVLAIYGSGDFITTEEDHRRIVDIVNAHAPGRATFHLIPGMDHHLDAAGTPQEAYDLRVKRKGTAPYDTALSTVVGDWLCARETCTRAG
jgi:pimeloyl-ACP methyl ester carboxylesterase